MEITISKAEAFSAHIPAILEFAQGRKIWLLTGEIGAGKTTSIRQLCAYFRVEDEISSPSYSIVNEYNTSTGDTVFHIDLYRLEDLDEAFNIGIEEYLHSGAYCFIEWPQLISPLTEELEVLRIHIEIQADLSRKILFLKD